MQYFKLLPDSIWRINWFLFHSYLIVTTLPYAQDEHEKARTHCENFTLQTILQCIKCSASFRQTVTIHQLK